MMDIYEIRNALNSGQTIYDIPLCVTYYARVSTDKDAQLHSLSAQVDYYSTFIKSKNNWTYVEGYVDEGLSGTSVAKRESFLKMIQDAKLKKFDFIITKEISRFSRNTIDSISYTQELLKHGVGVLFESDNINTLLPDSELRLTIMSSIAQDEVRKISERVKFGFKRAIENGVVLGNSKIWGYEKVDGSLKIVESEAEMVRKIYTMYATANIGIRKIAQCLTEQGYKNTNGNPLSFSTIKGILTNPKYKGYYCGNKSHKVDYKLNDRKFLDSSMWVQYKDEDNVPPIVSEELWDRANLILNIRSEKMSSDNKTSYQNKYAYSGKIICMEHNVPYYRTLYKYKSGNKEVWQCKEYSQKGRVGCSSPIIYTSELNQIMKLTFDDLICNKENLIKQMTDSYLSLSNKSQIQADIAKVNVEINNIQCMKDKLLELSIKGKLSDDEFGLRNDGFNSKIVDLEQQISSLEYELLKNKEIAQSAEILRQFISKELNFDDGFCEALVDSVLDRFEIYKTERKNHIEVKVYLKASINPINYDIKRARSTSVCSAQHILRVTNRSYKFARGLDTKCQAKIHTYIFHTELCIQLA